MNTEITKALADMAEAWNRGDAAAYAAAFTTDADYITFFGQRLHGRQAIEEVHRMLFEGPLAGSKMTGQSQDHVDVKMLTAEVGFVVSVGGATLDGGDDLPDDRVSIVSLTAVRDDGTWRFASFQNTRRTDPPGAGR